MKYAAGLVLVLAVAVAAIQVVVTQHEARRLFVQIQELEAERDVLTEEWGRLQLEQSTWATDDRIENLARTTLGMHEPSADTLMVVRP